MKMYDCDLCCGYVPGCKPCLSPEELLAAAGRAGLSGGLVRTIVTNLSGLVAGNRMLAEMLSILPEDYYGMWALSPSCVGEVADPQSLPAQMANSRIRALYVNPKDHQFLARPSVMGDYYAMAEERRIPLYLCTDYGLSLGEIDDILAAFPKLTCILNFCETWPSMRRLYPFLERYENLLLDIAYQWDDQGIEHLVRRFGAGRLLMGSYFPQLYIGGMLTYVHCAEISDAD